MKNTVLLFLSIALLGATIFVNADVGANFPNTTISFEAGKAVKIGSHLRQPAYGERIHHH